MANTISIQGLDKAEVLAALYNNARPQGMGFLQYTPEPMGSEEAGQLLTRTTYFDYLKGRVMKVSLDGDEFDPYLYDRDNGQGSAQRVIDELRATGDVNPETSELSHLEQRRIAAQQAIDSMQETSGVRHESDGTVTFRLGLSDVADVLKPIVDDVLDDSSDEQ